MRWGAKKREMPIPNLLSNREGESLILGEEDSRGIYLKKRYP
jgi:hypothetical protein